MPEPTHVETEASREAIASSENKEEMEEARWGKDFVRNRVAIPPIKTVNQYAGVTHTGSEKEQEPKVRHCNSCIL
jgi:hypothetical protein